MSIRPPLVQRCLALSCDHAAEHYELFCGWCWPHLPEQYRVALTRPREGLSREYLLALGQSVSYLAALHGVETPESWQRRDEALARRLEQDREEERQRDLFRVIARYLESFGKDYAAVAEWLGKSMALEKELGERFPDLHGPDDWKVYRDFLAAAEHFAREPPLSQLEMRGAVDAALDGIRERREAERREQVQTLQAQLLAKGCRLRTDGVTLWVGPARLVTDADADAIRGYRDELAQLVG